MENKTWLAAWVALLLVAPATLAATYSIPEDEVDRQKIFLGKASAFEKPGQLDYDKVVAATPEYAEIKKKKLKSGTGQYWILLGQASERVRNAISEVGKSSEYDLIVLAGYLEGLKNPIPADDITDLVIAKMLEKKKDPEKEKKDPKKEKNSSRDRPKKKKSGKKG